MVTVTGCIENTLKGNAQIQSITAFNIVCTALCTAPCTTRCIVHCALHTCLRPVIGQHQRTSRSCDTFQPTEEPVK